MRIETVTKPTATLKRLQNNVMDDLCHIHHISLSSGTYSTKSTEVRTSVTGVHCGIQFTNGSIQSRGETLLVNYDAILRVPISHPILMTDEIELVSKADNLISGTFRPYSQPVINSSVQHVQLKRVVA